jgi:NAD(P)H-hydrate epimerase
MTPMTREQVRAFDKHAIEQLGIPAAVLMENAGRGATDVLKSLGVHGLVVICCGKGNNGGDGLVIARHLANAAIKACTLLFSMPEDLAADAALQWTIVQRLNLETRLILDVHYDLEELSKVLAGAEWIVDALFGTGLKGPVRAPLDRVIEAINASPARKLAVDIPSGLDCDSGEPMGPTICADHTVTFVAPKVGFANPAAAAFTGHVHVVDIGIVPSS